MLKIIFKGPLVWIIFELTNRVTYYISLQQQYCHVQSRIPIFILNGIWKDCPCFVFLQSTRNIKVLSFLVFTYKVFHSQLLDLSQFHHISTMKTIISWLTWLIIEFRAFVSEILDDLIWVSLPQNIFIKNTFPIKASLRKLTIIIIKTFATALTYPTKSYKNKNLCWFCFWICQDWCNYWNRFQWIQHFVSKRTSPLVGWSFSVSLLNFGSILARDDQT